MNPLFETVELEGDTSFRVLRISCESLTDDHSWHYHPELELTYIVKGQGTQFVGDSVVRYKPGDLVMVGANLPHCWINDDRETPSSADNELIVIQFKSDFLGQQFLDLPEAADLKNLYRQSLRGVSFNAASLPQVPQLLEQLSSARGLVRLTSLMAIFELICTEFGQANLLTSDMYRIDNTDFQGDRLLRVINYVRNNLSSEIRQVQAAELVGMTPQSFSKFFHATTGRTFVSFVNVMRIMEACKLLVNTDRDVTDIAYSCGYGNLSNFNRRFLEIKKQTPTDYRNSFSTIATP